MDELVTLLKVLKKQQAKLDHMHTCKADEDNKDLTAESIKAALLEGAQPVAKMIACIDVIKALLASSKKSR